MSEFTGETEKVHELGPIEAMLAAREEERRYREIFLPAMISYSEEAFNRLLFQLLPEGYTVRFSADERMP